MYGALYKDTAFKTGGLAPAAHRSSGAADRDGDGPAEAARRAFLRRFPAAAQAGGLAGIAHGGVSVCVQVRSPPAGVPCGRCTGSGPASLGRGARQSLAARGWMD